MKIRNERAAYKLHEILIGWPNRVIFNGVNAARERQNADFVYLCGDDVVAHYGSVTLELAARGDIVSLEEYEEVCRRIADPKSDLRDGYYLLNFGKDDVLSEYIEEREIFVFMYSEREINKHDIGREQIKRRVKFVDDKELK
jgi:hypothetical protein